MPSALDELAALLGDSDLHLKVPAGTGMAFVVDNTRVLHGRIGQVAGRRRVVGGEAPAGAVAERWAEVARVSGRVTQRGSGGRRFGVGSGPSRARA